MWMRTASMASVRAAAGFFAFLFFLAVRLHAMDCMTVIVGDQVELPMNCESGETGTLQQDLGDEGLREVATYQSDQWKVNNEYRDWMKSNLSKIVLTGVQFTDGGMYTVSCSTSGRKSVQLEVVYAVEKSVTEGDDATLQCYYKTHRKRDLTGRWEKNGKPLCVKNSNYEECSDRLNVSTNWSTNGNLSLTIEGVQPEDGGDYFCYIEVGTKRSGTPAAVRLTVTEKMTSTAATAPPRNQTQSCAELTRPWQIATWVLLVILLLVALVFLYFWCRAKIRCDSGKLYKLVHRRCHASNSSQPTNG
ncbi:uncharacterized protein LOC122820576 [Gambusia affinis]|uniref:uncharacterized protein LOC122820576 n=1 Tax=Gambusia affinis TaxID=33528 RepID=UPI001CDCA813|nr:uncharacterized protein LOC122820576 [Gambusia affinis]